MTEAALSPDDLAALTALRRALHRRPELSGEEADTAAAIAEHLQALAPDRLLTNLGGHGVAAVFEGSAPGETVLVRSELDGLPIQEIGEIPHRSEIDGKAHLCGHDGHMAILCGVARRLARRRPARGRAVLLFQPAEETGDGARQIVSDPHFAEISPDLAVALHNLPGVELGRAWIRQGPFACASRGTRVTFTGRTAHSSQPETGVSPTNAMCDFIRGLLALSQGALGDADFARVTVVHARLGDPSYGVLPDRAEVLATLRTETSAALDALAARSEALAKDLAARDGLGLEIDYAEDFRATENDPEAVREVERALRDLDVPYTIMNAPMRWSEDFGVFGSASKAAMFGIGSGVAQPALHNPDYDFPDDLIDPASAIFARIIHNRLS